MSRLNMWQRLGIVASALWIVGNLLWENQSYGDRYRAAYNDALAECEQRTGFGELGCATSGEIEFSRPSRIRDDIWFNALAPVLFGWLLAYPSLWVARWVMAGRKEGSALADDKLETKKRVNAYYSLIVKAVSQLPLNVPESREEVYHRARMALGRMSTGESLERDRQELDEAIRRVERISPSGPPINSPLRPASTVFLAMSLLLPGLWLMDATCMSIYWVARIPSECVKRRQRTI